MSTILPNEKVHAKMLVETTDTFIYNNYLYRRSIRQLLITGPNYNKLKSYSIYEKTPIKICTIREETTYEDYYSNLKKFKKEYDFDKMWKEIKDLDTEMLEFLISIIITSDLIL